MSLLARFAANKAASALPATPTNSGVGAGTAAPIEVQATVESPMAQATGAGPSNAAMQAPTKRTYTRRTPPTDPAPAPAPAPAPTPVAAAPAPAPVQTRALSTFDPFSIITGQGAQDASDVLEMVLAKAEEPHDAGFDGPFPLVKLLKGNSGGSWTFGSNVDGEAAGVLPVAKNAVTAVFLGYRIYGVAWENSKLGHSAAGGDDSKAKPIWKVQIASADKELVQAALDAGEVYQFTKGHPQNDPRPHIPGTKDDFNGLGHFRPGVEMLFYRKGIVFAVRLPDHYNTTIRSLEHLGSVMRGLGGLRAVPVVVTPYTTDEKGATPWKCHAIRIECAITPEGKALAQEFAEIKDQMVADPEFGATFKEWNTTVIEDDAAAALKEIASMKKAR